MVRNAKELLVGPKKLIRIEKNYFRGVVNEEENDESPFGIVERFQEE